MVAALITARLVDTETIAARLDQLEPSHAPAAELAKAWIQPGPERVIRSPTDCLTYCLKPANKTSSVNVVGLVPVVPRTGRKVLTSWPWKGSA